ncbi:MAG TPA: hypothetical protein PLR18_03450 [bacterium]|nr:hypothetical protein [bacterium]
MSEKSIDYWQEYRLSQFWPDAKWQAYTNEKFLNIFQYAYHNNPIYKNIYDQNGINIKEIKSIKDIIKLPLVDRTELSMDTGLLSFNGDGDKLDSNSLLVRTSGSTGARMSFLCDAEQLDRRWGAWMRLFEWSGWQWGDKEMRFWYAQSSTIKKPEVEVLDAFLSNRHFYEFENLDDEELRFFCEEIKRLQPYLITGYWEAIEAIARYAYRNNIDLEVRGILPSTQVIPSLARKLVSQVFKSTIYDKYASSEFSGIGHQCEEQDLYHIQSENIYLEILRNGRPVEEGPGEAVVTDFSNRSTPLIRYRVGDVLEASRQSCPCSRTLAVFKRPLGRLKNIIKINNSLYTELHLANFEFSMWYNKICDRIKFVQTDTGKLTILVSGMQNMSLFKEKVEKFTKSKELEIILVDNIKHFRGKRHRGESKMTNIFNN